MTAQLKNISCLRKHYFSLQKKKMEHKEITSQILSGVSNLPFGFLCQNILSPQKDFFFLSLKALFSLILGQCYHGN